MSGTILKKKPGVLIPDLTSVLLYFSFFAHYKRPINISLSFRHVITDLRLHFEIITDPDVKQKTINNKMASIYPTTIKLCLWIKQCVYENAGYNLRSLLW